LKKTSFPRLFASVGLAAAFIAPSFSVSAQVSTQSYLRNTPSEIESQDPRVQQIIVRSEDHFKRGELNLKDGKRVAAREEFDRAVDTVLESGMDVRSNPRLQRYYLELVERVYRLEVPSHVQPLVRPAGGVQFVEVAQQGGAQQPSAPQVGFAEQKFEPSPLDELSKLELTEDEKKVTDAEVAKLDDEIKTTLDFKFRPHPLVQQFINYYQGRGRGTMETGLRRSGQYVTMARKIFREEGVPEDIVWLGQVESAWRPTARSWAAASGPWQFIPSTGARFGLRQTAYVDERNSFEKATRASARYLRWLANRYNGNWELAMGAYNTGEGNIDRAIARAGSADFWTIYPYIAQETRNYVPNILAVILIAKNPERYGFRNVERMAPLAYDTVSVPSATSLHLIASLTDVSVDYIRALNPELRRDMTPAGEAYHIRVPPKRGAQLVALLKRIPVDRRNQLARVVRAEPGENLQAVADRTGTNVAALQQWNAGVDLQKGGALVVPAGAAPRLLTPTAISRPRGNGEAATGIRVVAARAGETLAQFAARNGAPLEEVAKLNTLPANTTLKAGQRLNVPSSAKAAPAAPAGRRR
jgi:membrane-bound lytic murein transglycosylase D